MIKIEKKEECCGCGVCQNICPRHCISMEPDTEGFLYPKVDETKCVDCGCCEKVCPIHNTYSVPIRKNPIAYLGWADNKEMREKSTSGGVFAAVASYMLNKGAYVCGAAYENKNTVKHIIIHDEKDLHKLTRSKYVQSEIMSAVLEIQRLLMNRNDVLFSGTACQVYGLLSYLAAKNVSTDHLYTIDVVCHGTPSPKLLKEYIKWMETSKEKEVASVAMREKGHPKPFFSEPYTQVNFTDGGFYREIAGLDYYGRFFLGEISNRPICYHCPFKSIGKMSDITVGDCWFSRSLTGRKDVPFDVTLCLVHSERVDQLLKSSNLHRIQVDIEKAIRCNGGMIYSCNAPHPKREEFFQRLGKDDFGILAEEYFPVHSEKKDLKWKVKQVIKLIPGVYKKYYFDKKEKEFETRCRRPVPESARVLNEIDIRSRSINDGVQNE